MVLMVLARTLTLHRNPEYRPFVGLMVYQDVAACGVLSWAFYILLSLISKPALRRITLIAGWGLCLLLAAYTALHVIIYSTIRSPLTFRLLEISQNASGVEASVSEALSVAVIMIPLAILIMVGISELAWRLAPRILAQIYRSFHSRLGIMLILVYVAGAHVWAVRHVRYPPAYANPEWAFWSSGLEQTKPMVTDPIPTSYLADFQPSVEHGRPNQADHYAGRLDSASPRGPMNVQRSHERSDDSDGIGRSAPASGIRRGLHNDSPEILRLSQRAFVFDRAYAAQANTSAAMAALFCSLYPEHDWETLTRLLPELPAPALPAILERHGYRTGFIHSGQLTYDNDDEFLRNHGFGYVFGDSRDQDTPRDEELPAMVSSWIEAVPSKPFFLTVWTQDTHHPYVEPAIHDFRSGDEQLDHYLNGIRTTDDIIGHIMETLQALKIAGNTLLVITGDHGEAFREHGQSVHGFTVYEEEVHIPLLFVDPYIVNEVRINRVARQIDIPPTILDILGFPAPSEWQGSSLFSRIRPRRAYLFSADGNFSLGLVDGNYKYIYDFNRQRSELYDLLSDPNEEHDLSADAAQAAKIAEYHLRLEAWVSFQNSYIQRLAPANGTGGSTARLGARANAVYVQ
jgi:arylsulfatase A-like enzyme